MVQQEVLLEEKPTICRPPTLREIVIDRCFRSLTWGLAWLTILLLAYIVWEVGHKAAPALVRNGTDFLTSKTWDANRGKFGILPEIWGTLYSSILGVGIGTVFGLAVAIFLTENFVPPKVQFIFRNIVDLLAAVPSVVYGLWGIFVVIPAIRPAANWVHVHFSWIPIFGTRLSGAGMLPAAIVLAIMVLPTITALSRDALQAVPPKLREAAFGLGATRWETILAVILPTASGGIYGSIILAFGRAFGETMALAMLVGSANVISWSVFSPADTLAALLANHFAEAQTLERGALMYAAVVLLGITLLINILGAVILQRATRGLKGLR